jgi:hypothetical protein
MGKLGQLIHGDHNRSYAELRSKDQVKRNQEKDSTYTTDYREIRCDSSVHEAFCKLDESILDEE